MNAEVIALLQELAAKEPSSDKGNRIILFDDDYNIKKSLYSPNESKDILIYNETLRFVFANSTNCSVFIHENNKFQGSRIEFVHSKDSCIFMDKTQYKIFNLGIFSKHSRGSRCVIGANFSCVEAMINFSENAKVEIGDDCMLSSGINIWNWDGHTILDESGNCINHARDIYIGNHVWVGMQVSISKGAFISDNSVVGQKSLVSKKFPQSNVLIAGVPAKILKERINWDRKTPTFFE